MTATPEEIWQDLVVLGLLISFADMLNADRCQAGLIEFGLLLPSLDLLQNTELPI